MTPKNPSRESRGLTHPEGKAFINPRHFKAGSGAKPDEAGEAEVQGYLLLSSLVIPLPEHKATILGRDNDLCDLVLVNERVSKQHSKITYENGRYFVEDLGSLNGTFLNRERLKKRTPLVVGDKVRVRPYELEFAGPDHPLVTKHHKPEIVSESKDEAGHFAGQLQVVPLTDVIQLLNSSQQSGILSIEDVKKKRAKLIFNDGEIVAATYDGAFAEEAVYKALGVKKGSFDFLPGSPPAAPAPIRKKTLSLLLEGCRLLDEDTQPSPAKEKDFKLEHSQKTRQIPRLEL